MVGDASVWAGWEGRGQVCRACGGAAPAAASPSPRKTLALSLLKVDSPCCRVCVSRWLVVPWARRWRSGAVRRVVSRDASERRCDTHPGSGRKRGERSEKGQREGRERRASDRVESARAPLPPSLFPTHQAGAPGGGGGGGGGPPSGPQSGHPPSPPSSSSDHSPKGQVGWKMQHSGSGEVGSERGMRRR